MNGSEAREDAAGGDSRARMDADATDVTTPVRFDSRASCPHPEKVAHKSCGAALKARESLDDPADLALRPYRCVCGAWHLGHRGRNPKAQLRRALTAGRKANRQMRRRRKR